jgi:glycosyltransferase involved in cell wall biosynthesis
VPPPGGDARAARGAALDGAGAQEIWLTLAVVTGRLPTPADVLSASRAAALDGAETVLRTCEAALAAGEGDLDADVVVATGETLVDVFQTARLPRSTGIQRVSRALARDWADRPGVRLVGWSDDQRALVDLTAEERHHLLTDGAAPPPPPPGFVRPVVVPHRGAYLLPELAVGPSVTPRIQALAQHAGCRTGVVGFDCVPLTSGETTAPGTPSHFAGNLAAVRHMDHVAAISESAAREYRGWRTMVGATGLPGPEVSSVLLPVEAPAPDPELLDHVRLRYRVGDLPLLLVVGTHEPRKNHEAVLHAAQLLWRAGRRFSLLFVGAPGWSSESFTTAFELLTEAGLPLEEARDVDDDTLWCLFEVAHATVFPSLNEGFGLPVADSIALHTPVVTSNFGSTAEIAADGGALLVDPRDDDALAAAIDTLLTDRRTYDRLVAESRARPRRTWQDYADEVWTALTGASS